jgi:hypothetical protein
MKIIHRCHSRFSVKSCAHSVKKIPDHAGGGGLLYLKCIQGWNFLCFSTHRNYPMCIGNNSLLVSSPGYPVLGIRTKFARIRFLTKFEVFCCEFVCWKFFCLLKYTKLDQDKYLECVKCSGKKKNHSTIVLHLLTASHEYRESNTD